MSSADIIILVIVVLLIVGVIIFLAYQNKRSCAGCGYAKNCETFCAVIKKKEPTEEIE